MNQKVQNSFLFMLPAFIWGSTWYVIKFQLGTVDPILSVAYRFFLAGALLLLFCIISGLKLKFSFKAHFLFLLQGLSLFGLNYWLVYMAEQYLTSGLVAVIFSLIVFTNMLFSALIIKSRITSSLLLGGVLALSGTALIFKNEFLGVNAGSETRIALILGFVSLLLASLGNVISAYNQKIKLPLVQVNTFGMLYGAVMLFLIGLFSGVPVNFDTGTSYLMSLFYLSLFGSVIAFSSYLKMLGRIGPSKASYVVVVVPIIAMVFSTIFESYEWQKSTLIGMPILILGNLIAMDKIKPQKVFARWK